MEQVPVKARRNTLILFYSYKYMYRFATFFKEKIDKIRDELPDCSDIDVNIPQGKPPSTLSFL